MTKANLEKIDINGVPIVAGQKVRGFGFLECQGGFKIDLSPEVTVHKKDGILYCGGLSLSSFRKIEVIGFNHPKK